MKVLDFDNATEEMKAEALGSSTPLGIARPRLRVALFNEVADADKECEKPDSSVSFARESRLFRFFSLS